VDYILDKNLDEQTLLIALNRPDSLNALVPGLLVELIDTLKSVNHSRSIRSVIITGAGRAAWVLRWPAICASHRSARNSARSLSRPGFPPVTWVPVISSPV
jgi:1,4-dihydroxy-2-naphthoyl-CoA synthase